MKMDAQEKDGRHAAFEEILHEVEQDPSLQGTDLQEDSSKDASAEHDKTGNNVTGVGELLSGMGLLSSLPAMMELLKALNQPPEPYCSGKPTSAQCTALLRALRPYLNLNRQKTVDTIIRLSCLKDGIRALR
jgi:hypothetical protein